MTKYRKSYDPPKDLEEKSDFFSWNVKKYPFVKSFANAIIDDYKLNITVKELTYQLNRSFEFGLGAKEQISKKPHKEDASILLRRIIGRVELLAKDLTTLRYQYIDTVNLCCSWNAEINPDQKNEEVLKFLDQIDQALNILSSPDFQCSLQRGMDHLQLYKARKGYDVILVAIAPGAKIDECNIKEIASSYKDAPKSIPVLIQQGEQISIYGDLNGSGQWKITSLDSIQQLKTISFPGVGEIAKRLDAVPKEIYEEIARKKAHVIKKKQLQG